MSEKIINLFNKSICVVEAIYKKLIDNILSNLKTNTIIWKPIIQLQI